MSNRFVLHPEALQDLDEIWEYIAQDNPDAADRVIIEIFSALDLLASSPSMGHRRPELTSDPCDSGVCATTSSPMRQKNSLSGLSL